MKCIIASSRRCLGGKPPSPCVAREPPPKFRPLGQLGQERRVGHADEADESAFASDFAGLDGIEPEAVLIPVIAHDAEERLDSPESGSKDIWEYGRLVE